MIKTYRTINVYNLVTTVFVGGKECMIEFTGGHAKPYPRAGTFTTSDADLQRSIEGDIGYGISFILAESYNEEAASDVEENGTGGKRQNRIKKEIKKVCSIRTRQMAIEYLEGLTGKKISKNTGKETVVAAAAALGIEFPELN